MLLDEATNIKQCNSPGIIVSLWVAGLMYELITTEREKYL